MSRFESAVHNIGHHAVSGLSNLLSSAYEACESEGVGRFEIDLLSGKCFEEELNSYPVLCEAVKEILLKYESILTGTSGVKCADVDAARIKIDFLMHEDVYKKKKEDMKRIGVWYGHDPVYEFEISVHLKNGNVCKKCFNSFR
jgi:hypothetical protein